MIFKAGFGHIGHLTVGYATAPTDIEDDWAGWLEQRNRPDNVMQLQAKFRRAFDMRELTNVDFNPPVLQVCDTLAQRVGQESPQSDAIASDSSGSANHRSRPPKHSEC